MGDRMNVPRRPTIVDAYIASSKFPSSAHEAFGRIADDAGKSVRPELELDSKNDTESLSSTIKDDDDLPM